MLTFIPSDHFTIKGRGDVLVGPLPVNEAGENPIIHVGDTISVNGIEREIIGIESPRLHRTGECGLMFKFLKDQ